MIVYIVAFSKKWLCGGQVLIYFDIINRPVVNGHMTWICDLRLDQEPENELGQSLSKTFDFDSSV